MTGGLVEIKAALAELNEIRAEVASDKVEIRSIMNAMSISSKENQAASTNLHRYHIRTNVSHCTMTIGAHVKLQSRGIPKVVVADGIIVSLPHKGDNLGLIKISIINVHKPNEGLFLATRGGATVMGDALEQVVEWPMEDVLEV